MCKDFYGRLFALLKDSIKISRLVQTIFHSQQKNSGVEAVANGMRVSKVHKDSFHSVPNVIWRSTFLDKTLIYNGLWG